MVYRVRRSRLAGRFASSGTARDLSRSIATQEHEHEVTNHRHEAPP
jgi:hypothetical protein